MFQFASDKFNNTSVVVQQGIELSSYEGRIYDLRVVVQKDENSAWQVNLVSMRLAPYGSTITNISIGGKEIVLPLHEIEQYIPQIKSENLIDFSKRCALAIECFFGPQGVLGLDVGIDREGRLWLLEVNSKPCILDYLDLCNAQDAYKFYVSPVKYGLYLVKQDVDTVCKKLLYKYKLITEKPTML